MHAFWLVLNYYLLDARLTHRWRQWLKIDSWVILWTNQNSLLSIETNQFASFCTKNRLRQSAIYVSVKVAKFEIKRLFSVHVNSFLYKKQTDSILPYFRSVIDHRGRQTAVRSSETHLCATFLFLPHFDVICDLLLNRCKATWNLFVKYFSASISYHNATSIIWQAKEPLHLFTSSV